MKENSSSVRCAIYTRKSSEEGLEQSFNSLDAQREACEAFVLSQREEGWRVLPGRYDDGGYSGGNMERPGLQQLMRDVEEHKLDTIVVYKVDRLTRSLADFAKIVEGLDARGVSFVSVTQQFNTTSSMGRLTLNVLLSFAQFEREVTGERIRDKIAASKRKGMWMGGPVPLGYDVKDRKLLVNSDEAKVVCGIYRRYLRLGCVSKLKTHLDRLRVRSKIRVSANGHRSGGVALARGALYEILKNRIYIGQVTHREQSFAGEHQAIVPLKLWEQVQAQLTSANQGRRNGVKASSPSLLTGLIRDASGNRFTPSHTVKNGKRYRYYVCRQTRDKKESGTDARPSRLPAHQIETLVISRLRSFLASDNDVIDELRLPEANAADLQQLLIGRSAACNWLGGDHRQVRRLFDCCIERITVNAETVEMQISKSRLRRMLIHGLDSAAEKPSTANNANRADDRLCLSVAVRFKLCSGEVRLIVSPPHDSVGPAYQTQSLLKAVARGQAWREQLIQGKVSGPRELAGQTGLDERYTHRILRCGFLAPTIVEAILTGTQPADLHIQSLLDGVPLSWADQRRHFGFSASANDR